MNSTTVSERPVGIGRLYQALWRYAEGMRSTLVIALGLLFASQLIKLAVPWLAGQAINAIQAQGSAGAMKAGQLLFLMFLATAASWLLHGPGRIMERNVAMKVRAGVSRALLDRLLAAPLAWHESHHSGETAHRLHQSASALYDFAQSQFIYLQNAVLLFGPLIALWLISAPVGGAALLGFGLLGWLIMRFDRSLMTLAVEENRTERHLSAVMLETLGNVLTVFSLRRWRGMSERAMRAVVAVFVPLRRAIVLNEGKWCAVDVLSTLLWCSLVALYAVLQMRAPGVVAASAAEGLPAATGATGGSATAGLSLGNIYMVYEYSMQAAGVITALAAHFQSLARQRSDYASGAPIEAIQPVARAEALSGERWDRLQTLSWRYRHQRVRGEKPTLDAISLTLEAGRRYALIGPSGSGKSTLLRLLSGLDRPESGGLRIDGREIAADDFERALGAVATLVPQQAEIFEGSLRDNLGLGAEVSDADVETALRVACADDLVRLLPDGLQTWLAEGGVNWSGGQRQRVALARGVLAAQGSRLVLFDEPTSSLDPETERRVYRRLFEHFAEACVVSSVHRLHLLDDFDAVVLMVDGHVVDQGRPAELAVRSALFREMLAAQDRARSQPAGSGGASQDSLASMPASSTPNPIIEPEDPS